MITQAQVVAEARSWIGVPYRHLGRDRFGVDCVGLPIVIGKALRLVPGELDFGVYGRLPTGMLGTRIGEFCRPLARAAPGALIVIRWQKNAAHVGICTGNTMIHSYEGRGKVIEHGYRGRWISMTHSLWALPGVSYE